MFTLQLADVNLDAGVGDAKHKPLGSRTEIAARLVELLPGTEFDGTGRGVFKRGTYELHFLICGEQATAVGVALDQADGFRPLTRIADKTGWRVIDPTSGEFVDLEASRSAGKVVLAGAGAPPLSQAPVQGTSRRTLALVVAGAVVAVAIGSPWLWPSARFAAMLPTTILARQRTLTTRFEKYEDRKRRRATLVQKLAPAFRSDPIVAQLVDAQMAWRSYWNFMDGHYTSPEVLADSDVWSRFLMPTFLPASFGQARRDGYSFEFKGEGCQEPEPGWPECLAFVYIARPAETGRAFALYSADDRIHFRDDGTTPKREDPVIFYSAK